MEPLSNLLYLLEPASLALITTAVLVVLASAHRALSHERDSERHRDFAETSITLDGSQALMIPIGSSISLLLMFYLFASMSQLITIFTALASASSLIFCFGPFAAQIMAQVGMIDSMCGRCCGGSFTRSQAALTLASTLTVIMWLVSGHWVLNNLLGIAICITFVAHVRLPNIKICAILLVCLFFYDIFWVFFSERFFGQNVMVSVATQQAHNPVRTVANTLHIPVSDAVTTKLDLPVKLLFPRNLFGGGVPSTGSRRDFMMLGLGDMAIPGMLLAFVLCFDHRKAREYHADIDPARRRRYIWWATSGYAVGLVAALAAGVLTRSAQPALLYLVPSTLGPVFLLGWLQNELSELWHGSRPIGSTKDRLPDV